MSQNKLATSNFAIFRELNATYFTLVFTNRLVFLLL